jgi:hypothetical protein
MPTGYVPPDGRPQPLPSYNITKALSLLSSLANPSEGMVVVSYASNNYNKYSITEILSCLQTIYDHARNAGHRCIISTTQPRSDSPFESSEMRRKLAVIKDSIINRFGTEHTLNFYDGMFNPSDSTILEEYSAGDEIHLNNAGHKELFSRFVAKNFIVTSVDEAIGELQFFPNPFKQKISFHRKAIGHVRLVDAVGRVVFKAEISEGEIAGLEGLAPGVYTIILTDRGKSHVSRAVKL